MRAADAEEVEVLELKRARVGVVRRVAVIGRRVKMRAIDIVTVIDVVVVGGEELEG